MEYFSYGEYFLYGGYDGAPVYQHFAGVEYLYRKDGNWLISDEIGLREAGLQNQVGTGTIDLSLCSYRGTQGKNHAKKNLIFHLGRCFEQRLPIPLPHDVGVCGRRATRLVFITIHCFGFPN